MEHGTPADLSPELAERIARLLGATPRAWRPIHGGYTDAGRWVVRFSDGASAFVKAGTSPDTARWLRDEWGVYGRVSAPYLPRVLGWEDDEAPLLVLEDLGSATWPPPWEPGMAERVVATLGAVAATPAPHDLPALEGQRAALGGWVRVADDPASFLSLGLCTPVWLDAALPSLVAAETAASLAGESLLHTDVRSDNLCLAGDRVVLVDWNWASRGNPRFDVAAFLPSLRAEGGPAPEEIMPNAPEYAALLSGYWAARAGRPPPAPGSELRALQLRQLRVALPWATAALSLPPPDGLPSGGA